jgi:nucleoid DNA-binding protein
MNKKQLIDEVSYLLGKSPIEVKRIVDTTFEVISLELTQGNSVSVHNFARFRPDLRVTGRHYDMATKEIVGLPPTNVVRFKPYALLKKRLNSPCAYGNCPIGGV